MSRNLVIKQMFAVVDPEEKRVIDVNALMQKRMEAFEEKSGRPADGGFAAGLDAQETEAFPADGESGNVIKVESPEELLERAREEAAAIVAEARAEAMELVERARTEAEVEKNKILGEARQQGYVEGQGKAAAEGKKVRQEYAEKEKQLEAVWEAQLQDMEPQLVDAITGIYEHIFHVELGSYREILAYLISAALHKLEGGHEFVVHVSKEDYPYVSMQKKQILAGTAAGNYNVDVVEDLTLSKNDCMIETDGGIFDCGLGTQLSGLRQKLQLLSWSKEE